MYAPYFFFCFLRRFCTAQGANARACTGYLSFHTLASKKLVTNILGFPKPIFLRRCIWVAVIQNKTSYSSKAGCAEKTTAHLCEEEQLGQTTLVLLVVFL